MLADRSDAEAAEPDRPEVILGTLLLDEVVVDQHEQDGIVFDPARLCRGIRACGDPVLEVRSAAYRVAFERRRKGYGGSWKT